MTGGVMRRYGLSFFIFGLFFLSLAGQWFTHDWEQAHAMSQFWNAVFENWQSEAWQVGLFIWASAKLTHAGSPQSKDGDERMERKIDAVMDYLLAPFDPESPEIDAKQRRAGQDLMNVRNLQ